MESDDIAYSMDYFDPYLSVGDIIILPPRVHEYLHAQTDRAALAEVTLVEYIDHELTNVKLTKYELRLWVNGKESKQELLDKIHAAFVSSYADFSLPDLRGEEISLKIDTRSSYERARNTMSAVGKEINNKTYTKASSKD